MIAGSLLVAGCGKKADDADTAPPVGGKSSIPSSPSASGASNPVDTSQSTNSSGPALTVPDPAGAKTIQLTPENTKIQFVGTHVGPKPDPQARVGTFKEFTGQAVLGSVSQSLESISLDIQAGSLETQMGKLNNHLNTEDFLDTRSHPTIRFKSKSISKGEQGKVQIVGDLTLHGVTKEVTIPADVAVDGGGHSLKAEFTIDRTEYGMDRMLERVNKEVDITVTIGNTADAAE
jgi:polyisoprenoid-binding protein YceI